MFFSKIIGFQRKSWIETHIKSHILVIMEQKSRASFEPVLSNEDPLKKQRVTFPPFFLILTDFSSILIKNNMKYPKNPFFLMKIEYKTIFLRCVVQKMRTACFSLITWLFLKAPSLFTGTFSDPTSHVILNPYKISFRTRPNLGVFWHKSYSV